MQHLQIAITSCERCPFGNMGQIGNRWFRYCKHPKGGQNKEVFYGDKDPPEWWPLKLNILFTRDDTTYKISEGA